MTISGYNSLEEFKERLTASVSQLISKELKEFDNRLKIVEFKASSLSLDRLGDDQTLRDTVGFLSQELERMKKFNREHFYTLNNFMAQTREKKVTQEKLKSRPLDELRHEVSTFKLK